MVFFANIEINDWSPVIILCNHLGKIILFTSVFRYVSQYDDRPNARPFILGMLFAGAANMIREGSLLRLKAASGWVRR